MSGAARFFGSAKRCKSVCLAELWGRLQVCLNDGQVPCRNLKQTIDGQRTKVLGRLNIQLLTSLAGFQRLANADLGHPYSFVADVPSLALV